MRPFSFDSCLDGTTEEEFVRMSVYVKDAVPKYFMDEACILEGKQGSVNLSLYFFRPY